MITEIKPSNINSEEYELWAIQGIQSFKIGFSGTKEECIFMAKMFKIALNSYKKEVIKKYKKFKIKNKWKETGFELSNGTKFSIYHNLPEVKGLSIQDAFQNWLVRTNKYTAKSFTHYIKLKQTEYLAYIEEEWNKLKNGD